MIKPYILFLQGIEFTLNNTGDVAWNMKNKSCTTPALKPKEFCSNVEEISQKVEELAPSSEGGTSSDEIKLAKLSCKLETKDDLPSELNELSLESNEIGEYDSSFKSEKSSVNPESVFIKPLVDKPEQTFIPLLHCTAYQVTIKIKTTSFIEEFEGRVREE